ncbi:MAG: SNF2-related protein [Acidimicrobiales bacterium]
MAADAAHYLFAQEGVGFFTRHFQDHLAIFPLFPGPAASRRAAGPRCTGRVGPSRGPGRQGQAGAAGLAAPAIPAPPGTTPGPGSTAPVAAFCTLGAVLAVHALWLPRGSGQLLLWGEDSEMPPAGPPPRGRRPAAPRPLPHPFAAAAEQLAPALAESGNGTALALKEAVRTEAVVWLPGVQHAPEASAQLIRAHDEAAGPGDPRWGRHPGLWPFRVPALGLAASPALDAVLALADHQSPELVPGASVRVMATLAGLALEVVGGGRALPGLVGSAPGHYLARWAPLGGGHDEERLRLLAVSLPPLCRALDSGGPRGETFAGEGPESLLRHALEAFVDTACRDALGRAKRSLLALPARPGGRNRPAAEAWLAALAGPEPEVDADPGELAKLERLIGEWRAGALGRGGPWRLCFRLREPEGPAGGEAEEGESGDRAGQPSPRAETTWRVELLLQATDDPSLVIAAEEVWRCGAALRRAARVLEAPHEVLLAELGRARCAYPELSGALRLAAPTAVETDVAGAYRFLSEVAPALEVAGFGVLLPAWWRHPSSRLGAKLRARSNASGAHGGGLLDEGTLCQFDWQAAIGDQDLTLRDLEALARLKAPLVQVRGRWLELRPGEAARLAEWVRSGRREAGAGRPAMTVPELLRAAAGVDETVAGVPVVAVEADGLLGALLRGELEDHLLPVGTPPGFAGRLRPYQERGVAWLELLGRTGLGACLADDMGLGKTAMVLALLAGERSRQPRKARAGGQRRRPARSPTLVVCPTSVVGNWKREAEKFVPELKVIIHHGSGRARTGTFSKQMTDADVVVTSYSLVDRDRGALSAVPWSRVVLDEAQNVKNPEAKQTKAVRALAAPHRIALTGTPVENHLGELWSIMDILNPGLLGPASTFREVFALPIERYREEEPAERLRALTRPFVLRRLKTDRTIITDLPDKLEMKVFCTLTREQATLYRAVVDEMLRRINEADGMERRGLVLATMLRLKQVCNHPAHYLGDGSALAGRSGKLERTIELLDEVMQGSERALVFTQFAEMGAMLRSHVQQRLGCQVAFLHGGVARRQRDAMVDNFQSGSGAPVMVLSLKAGGTGLNLTAASHVLHFDRWWNPAVENQATDRAFRIGQRRNVQVRKLVCTGTLEDRIDQMIEAKRELAERIVGAGEAWLTELSTAELADVFRLSAEALG